MLLSRVADTLYWISRYLERAEHTARVIDVRLDLGLDRVPDSHGWNFSRLHSAVRVPVPSDVPASPAALVESLMFDLSNRDSVMACVTAARDNARQVREEISPDMWEQVNALFLLLQQAPREGTWSVLPPYLSRMVIDGSPCSRASPTRRSGTARMAAPQTAARTRRRDRRLVDLHFNTGAVLPANHVEWVGLPRRARRRGLLPLLHRRVRPDRIAEFSAESRVPAVGPVRLGAG